MGDGGARHGDVTPSQLYQGRASGAALTADTAQLAVLDRLDRLANALAMAAPRGWRKLIGGRPAAVRGLYIHGEVGRGKTMLMDLFFDSIQGVPKRRVHFHAFMQDVHRQRAALRGDDVIGQIAGVIAAEARLLCLDEMQITDIADAMIIGRLFEALEGCGVCLVTTSNLAPEELYKDGLNRDLFLPFIGLLRSRLDVVPLDGKTDYRLGRVAARETYIVPADEDRLDALWQRLADGDAGEPVELDVLGRRLHVPRAAHGCARFSFSELCESALGPPDFLALAARFRTVFVSNIPVMEAIDRNAVKRFVLMIDTFYDARTRFVATAAAAPERLYGKGHHGFEFKRTVSRLREMQSDSWWSG